MPLLPDVEPLTGRDIRLVPDYGPESARLLLVGEAPGQEEHLRGRPFVGNSGMLLRRITGAADISLPYGKFRITNVVPYWPGPGEASIKLVPTAVKEHYAEKLKKKIAKLPNVKMIVACGNVALWALFGHEGISNWRGSRLTFTDANGREIECIPIMHPAAVLRAPSEMPAWRSDWRRIAEDYRRGGPPKRTTRTIHIITRPGRPLWTFLDWLRHNPTAPITIDIETTMPKHPLHPRIRSIGFANSPHEAWVFHVEAMGRFYHRLRPSINEVLRSPNPKTTQKGYFDCYWLEMVWGTPVVNWRWDTLAIEHTLDPNAPHDLAYMASRYLDVAYWKHLDRANLAYYNGLDCCYTHELREKRGAVLRSSGLTALYDAFHLPLKPVLLRLTKHGIRFSREAMAAEDQRQWVIQCAAAAALKNLTGYVLVKKKDISGKLLKEILYTKRGFDIPAEVDPKTKKPTTDEEALRRIEVEYELDGRIAAVCRNVRAFRAAKKKRERLDPTKIDKDGRFRATYEPFAKSFRLRSSSNPIGTGDNAQNVDRELRSIAVADYRCILLGVDGAQAEDKVVAALTRDPDLIARARRPPWELDVHSEMAELIFDTRRADHSEEAWKELRYLAKRIVHASNYGMGPDRLVATILQETGKLMTRQWAFAMLRKVAALFPTKERWKDETKQEVITNRCISNSWGASLVFDDAELNAEAYRLALSWRPQSEVGMWMNMWGLIPADRYFQAHPKRGAVNAQTHDGLLCSVRPQYAWALWTLLRSSLERPRRYAGTSLVIPLELSIGESWDFDGDKKKGKGYVWKKPPERAEFEKALASLRPAE